MKYFYRFLRQKVGKIYGGKKYRFELELDQNWTRTEVQFKVQPDA